MTREILIANTKTQTRTKLETEATTLGELKAAMDAAGIDYSGMTFTEGISKTQLLEDATQLPQNLMYKGQPTNNLVILLTNTKDKISSGAMTRKEAYDAIKECALEEKVKSVYGRNYTQVPTCQLEELLKDALYSAPSITPVSTQKENTSKETALRQLQGLKTMVFYLKEMCSSVANTIDDLDAAMSGMEATLDPQPQKPVSTSDGSITDEDINVMIENLA